MSFEKFVSSHVLFASEYPEWKYWKNEDFTKFMEKCPIYSYDANNNMTVHSDKATLEAMFILSKARELEKTWSSRTWAYEKEMNTILIITTEDVESMFTRKAYTGFESTNPLPVITLYRTAYGTANAWKVKTGPKLEYVVAELDNEKRPTHYRFSNTNYYESWLTLFNFSFSKLKKATHKITYNCEYDTENWDADISL